MPQGLVLSTEEKFTIKILSGLEFSVQKISECLGRHRTTIMRYLKGFNHLFTSNLVILQVQHIKQMKNVAQKGR